MDTRVIATLRQASLYVFIGLLAYMPLHILLSTWIGSTTHTLEVAKVAKDGVLVAGFLLTLALSVRQPWFKGLLRDKLLWLILAYAALTLLLAAIKPTDSDAEILGLVYNTRFLLFFLYGILLAHLFPGAKLRRDAVKAVVGVGAVVALFGIIQYLVLPNDALIHIGYSRDNGVLPAFFIDEKPDLERVMSTVRDPNSLGSYLIIIGTLLASGLIAVRTRLCKLGIVGLLGITLLCLWFTFSRSAVLGFAVAAASWVLLSDPRFKQVLKKRKKAISITSVVALVALGGIFYAAHNTYVIQNVVFHADHSTVLEDPNQLRLRFWKESAANIIDNPVGSGPGTAGLASIHNNVQGVVLNENYYLQIGTEVGILGLLLFLAILAVVAKRLFALRQSPLALALLASFIGLALTNVLVHIWSNEAVAYTWWGLAGLALIPREQFTKGGKTRARTTN